MGDVTRLLNRWADGDTAAFEALMPVVYAELRRLADGYLRRERPDHTLQPTALVHEAYLRLAGTHDSSWNGRAHFYGAAAQAMRRVLVDYARQRRRQKRGGGSASRVAFDDTLDLPIEGSSDVIALDDALAALERVAPNQARVVELRYFGGLTVEETAQSLGVAPATVKRHWAFARAWLYRQLDRRAVPAGK